MQGLFAETSQRWLQSLSKKFALHLKPLNEKNSNRATLGIPCKKPRHRTAIKRLKLGRTVAIHIAMIRSKNIRVFLQHVSK